MTKGTEIDAALRTGALEAARLHRFYGAPLVIWRDGKIVFVLAHEFEAMGESAV